MFQSGLSWRVSLKHGAKLTLRAKLLALLFVLLSALVVSAPTQTSAEPERGCGNYTNYNDLVMSHHITPTSFKHLTDILNWRDHVKTTYGERVYQWVGLVENCWPSPEWPRAICVLNGESRGRVDAVGKNWRDGKVWSKDLGLWQINNHYHADKLNRHGWRWQDPVTNTIIAKEIWERAGNSWRPWYACSR